MLRRLEWVMDGEWKCCPVCGHTKEQGHLAKDCQLAAMIAKYKETPK
jgi:hypothetical protein